MEKSVKTTLLITLGIIVFISMISSFIIKSWQKQFIETGDEKYEKRIKALTAVMALVFGILICLTIYLMKQY